MDKFILPIKKFINAIKKANEKATYTPTYRILEILCDEEECYTVNVQLIGKSAIFNAKPEELLSNDNIVDQFSPRDIRTLTYLGYLGINTPKYKLLAKRLVDDNKIIFAVKKRGSKEIVIKTAKEIINEQEIISSLHPYDAKTIGYTVASESFQEERKFIEETKSKQNHDRKK